MRFLGRALTAAGQWLTRCARAVRRWWSGPTLPLVEEVGRAVAAVTFATADLYRLCCQIPYAVLVLLRAFLALQRILRPPKDPNDPKAPVTVPDRMVWA